MAAALLSACKAGEPSAWRQFFEARAGQVYRWAVVLGMNPSTAEDVAQEVLATAARRIATCSSEAALTSWLYQITRRVVANKRRLAWWRRVLPVAEPEPGPAFEHVHGAGPEMEIAVRTCLKKLKKNHVEALLLAYVEGFTKEEVAAILGIPPGTVATRLRLAKLAFLQLWEETAGAHAPPLGAWERP